MTYVQYVALGGTHVGSGNHMKINILKRKQAQDIIILQRNNKC